MSTPVQTATPVPHSLPSGRPTTQPRKHPGTRGQIGRAVIYLALTLALAITLLPLLIMVLGSFKSTGELTADPTGFLPRSFTLENYAQWFGPLHIQQYFVNTLIVAICTVIGNLIFCSMAGYALAKMRFRGRNLVFVLVLITLMVPTVVTFVPMFITISKLGLINTYPSLFLPFLAQPVGVFLMRQFIVDIPDSLLEASRIDGAGEARIFLSIVMPLCQPALATLAILTFLGSWNNFLWPLVAAQNESVYTLPVALSLFSVGSQTTNYGLLLAGAGLIVTPVVILFLSLQRYFTQSIVATGIK